MFGGASGLRRSVSSSAVPALPGLIFFASGFAALVYQIVWQRLLVIFSGSDVHSATIIVAAFMAGLGCGNLAGAQVADRLSRAANLACFAAAELAIAAFGFFSADAVLRRALSAAGPPRARASRRAAAMLFVSLLWPTFFMGVSLPLLARALTHRDRPRGARSPAGCTPAIPPARRSARSSRPGCCCRRYGLEGSLQISAAVNLFAAAGVVPLAAPAYARPRSTE